MQFEASQGSYFNPFISVGQAEYRSHREPIRKRTPLQVKSDSSFFRPCLWFLSVYKDMTNNVHLYFGKTVPLKNKSINK